MPLFRYLAVVAFLLPVVLSCREESINPDNKLASTIYGFARKKTGASHQFYVNDPHPLELEFSWSTQDLSIKVQKIEFFVSFDESYLDSRNNLKIAHHNGGEGLLIKTWEGAELPSVNLIKIFSLTQQEIYERFKDASFDYEGDGKQVPIFNNPARPERVTGARFVAGDEFNLTWVLYTTDGDVLTSWPDAVCTQATNSNCSYPWVVKCEYKVDTFADEYICHEPRYTDYPVTFTSRQGSATIFVNNNFWNSGASVEYRVDLITKTVTIPEQGFSSDGLNYVVSGRGTVDTCTGEIVTDYVVTKSDAGRSRVIDTNTHTFRKPDN